MDSGTLSVKLGVLHEDVTEIKQALGKLSDAITKLALVEQSQAQAADALERAFKAIERIENRLMVLEQAQTKNLSTSNWVDWALKGGVAVLLAFVAKSVGLI